MVIGDQIRLEAPGSEFGCDMDAQLLKMAWLELKCPAGEHLLLELVQSPVIQADWTHLVARHAEERDNIKNGQVAKEEAIYDIFVVLASWLVRLSLV